MSRKSSGNGHWKNPSKIKLDPDNSFGFVYLIVNLESGQRYIGKKQYHKYSKGKRMAPSDWRSYTSSSRYVNDDIRRHGKQIFHFEILAEFDSRSGLTYAETNLQHVCHVLTEVNREGDRLFYNQFIDKIRFIPQEYLTEEQRKKVVCRVLKDFH